jgi:DNA polymerase III subunit gamma/tau
MSDSNTEAAPAPYQVLARKYRPQNFDDLLGHGAMVRTLRNAFASGRIAHAYILTGVRGIGKTTTARILARALNYEVEGKIDAPSIDMPEEGLHCRAIAESRHQDVIEMDAASRTGVGDIRELIESVRYAPVEARYKVYIIDEVHMLSNSAFNALLKTLEEPPPHVKFIFATTEIRKLPVTVLSRCQRFDLRRFDGETIADYLSGICDKENVKVARDGLLMIAKAAEGSVRDALSLLDQAIIQSSNASGNEISAEIVRDMLGLANRSDSWDMLEAAMKGNAPEALSLFRGQYDQGADPVIILKDLLELVHLLTRVKAAGKEAASHGAAGAADVTRALALADAMPMAALTRAWNLLLKGHGETLTAPDAIACGEIALIRLCFAADLPTPDEALRQLKQGSGKQNNAPIATSNSASAAPMSQAQPSNPVQTNNNGTQAQAVRNPAPAPQETAEPMLSSLRDVARLAGQKRDANLRMEIETMMRLVRFDQGLIEFHPTDSAPHDLAGRLAQRLKEWTGERWIVSINARAAGDETLRSERDQNVFDHPMMKAAFETFPDIDPTKNVRIEEVAQDAAMTQSDDSNIADDEGDA